MARYIKSSNALQKLSPFFLTNHSQKKSSSSPSLNAGGHVFPSTSITAARIFDSSADRSSPWPHQIIIRRKRRPLRPMDAALSDINIHRVWGKHRRPILHRLGVRPKIQPRSSLSFALVHRRRQPALLRRSLVGASSFFTTMAGSAEKFVRTSSSPEKA